MTIAPERESLEELDFPTPDLGLLPPPPLSDRVLLTPAELAAVQERTRQELLALWAAPMTRVEMTRLGPLAVDYGILAGGAYRDWDCYCSPSRSMLLGMNEMRARQAARLEALHRRQLRVLAGFFALWAVLALLTLLV